MAEIVNLRMARKARARAEDKARADANRAQHGRSAIERKATAAQIARIERTVDGAKRERPAQGPHDAEETAQAPDSRDPDSRDEA